MYVFDIFNLLKIFRVLPLMVSSLRVRTRQSFGFGATGSGYQHCYELALMTTDEQDPESDNESETSTWDDDLIHEFHRDSSPSIYMVEKLNLHFSDQFSFRFSWPSVSCEYLNFVCRTLFLF